MEKPEQTLRLSELPSADGGLLRRIAEVMIQEHGFYTCTIAGKKTLVVRG